MPVPSQIANAAVSFRRNGGLMEKCFASLTPEEWLKTPDGNANPMLWIGGHILWARSATLKFLGAEWSRPWLRHFGRGIKRHDVEAHYPTPEEFLAAFGEAKILLRESLENTSAEAMAAPAPPNTPPGDGTLGGIVNFLAFHETYHVGQAAYLRCWLGHEGPQG